jgi:hypothetical protein
MTPLIHNYSNVAGKILYWDTSDNEEHYLKNIQDSVKRKQLQDLGFLDVAISYQFNSHGFRNAEFELPVDIACFGCSFTMGTGVHAQDAWPSQLQQLTGMTVVNLGHAGSSNDTAFRFATHYLELLKPRYAVWQQTDMHRIELLDDYIPLSLNIIATDTNNPCAHDYYIKTWTSSTSNQQLNLLKNTLAFKQLCTSLNITPIVLPRENILSDRCARDLRHPGVAVYKTLAKHVAELLGQ